MKNLIIFLAVCLLNLKGFSQDWVLVGSDIDGNKWYIKSSFVSKSEFGTDGDIKIWTKKELKKTSIRKNGKTLIYNNAKELQLIEANCNDKKIKFITTTVYNSQGRVIDSWTYAEYEQEWKDVVPDSMGEATLDKICELFK